MNCSKDIHRSVRRSVWNLWRQSIFFFWGGAMDGRRLWLWARHGGAKHRSAEGYGEGAPSLTAVGIPIKFLKFYVQICAFCHFGLLARRLERGENILLPSFFYLHGRYSSPHPKDIRVSYVWDVVGALIVSNQYSLVWTMLNVSLNEFWESVNIWWSYDKNKISHY